MVESSTLEEQLALEQAHVDAVYVHLAHAERSARQVAADGASRYTSDRESYVREEDGTALFERDAFAYQAARRLAILDAEHEGLVFGKLNLTDGEERYIGRIGVRDEDFEPLVIDWRAPASEPFYRATPSAPMGVIRRRVLRCRDDIVIGIEDDLIDADAAPADLVVIGEGALMASLSRARDHRMHDIVATIQAAQDEAIRAPYAGVTVIAGGPGTGKTVVALHRAAYLLYSNRRRFENGGVLVVGPSAIFMNYIERVLPSLGEDTVTLHSLGQIASDVLGFSATSIDTAAAAVVKGSLRMVPVLERLVATGGSSDQDLLLTVKGEPLRITAAQAARIRGNVLSHSRYNAGRESAEKQLVTALRAKAPEALDVESDEHFDDLVTSSAQFRAFMATWWPPISATQALRSLSDRGVLAQVAPDLSPTEQQALAESFAEPGWTVADVALLDELVSLLGPVPVETEAGPDLFLDAGSGVTELVTTADLLATSRAEATDEVHSTYAHVLVDEAQDITPMQWRMLRRRGAQASWTVVGDPAQSSWPDVAEAEQALNDLIGTSPHRTFRLATNYRSPAEVFDLAARYIVTTFPQADLPQAVRSTGIEPLLASTTGSQADTAIADHLATLLEQVGGTVAAIVPPSRAAQVAEVMAGDMRLAENPRLTMVTALESKGLEYDAVLVVDPDAIVAETSGGPRVLYVALTRATQRLVTLDIGQPGQWRPESA